MRKRREFRSRNWPIIGIKKCGRQSMDAGRICAETENLRRGNINMTFEEAFTKCKAGKGMRLNHWSPDVVIRTQYPDKHSKMTAPYLYVESRYGKVPWKETMIELFSDKWETV